MSIREDKSARKTSVRGRGKEPRGFLGFLQSRSVRETVESVVIAVVLAFLFRTFVAEPFVIPTGSMAPTLQGRHQQVDCPVCKFSYRIGASEERPEDRPSGDVFLGTCPQCGFVACTKPEVEKATRGRHKRKPFTGLTTELATPTKSRNGDRILVSKSAYEFAPPQRWDVFVFHFPGNAARNYIKRLVGLPGEWLKIRHGDVFRSPTDDERQPDADAFAILRKPADVVLHMMQLVYDNNYASTGQVVELMTSRNWPTRWSAVDGGWKSQDHNKSFEIAAQAEPRWIRYRHFLPTLADWQKLYQLWQRGVGELPLPGGQQEFGDVRPQLITDLYPYNSFGVAPWIDRGRYGFLPQKATWPGMNWVGDLIVDFQLDAQTDAGQAVVELVEGGYRFRGTLDLQKGTAELTILDPQDQPIAFESPTADGSGASGSVLGPVAKVPIKGPGRHRVTFANVDDRLLLWIDGKAVSFDVPTNYPRLANLVPTEADLAPVGIGAVGASLKVDDIKLYRDVYYIAAQDKHHTLCDLRSGSSNLNRHMRKWVTEGDRSSIGGTLDLARDRADFFSDPRQWVASPGSNESSPYLDTYEIAFRLQKFPDDPALDQFFALGDNSPASQDSRLWWTDNAAISHYVERKLIIGRALLIYWPLGHFGFIQ
ncbi:MAG: S26 family signal peptidase [Planctomycetota bacterium]|nr:MAG: S26 family signal peptidase [Planctomycetota bacterium]REK44707.1 MAG: S26 family signal peptidase [Planctomycetota bacterium]